VVHKPTAMIRAPIMQSLFQGIQDKAGMGRSAHPPANDTAGECIDHESDVDKACDVAT